MHWGKREKEREGRLEDGNSFYLYRTRIGRSAVKKNTFTLAVGW
jgi:hypothetical protein